jgi:hypothetical protein
VSVSPYLLTRRLSKDAFRGSPECMWRCLRSTRSNACPNISVAYCYNKRSVLPRYACVRRYGPLVNRLDLDQGHAERSEGLGQIDACEMSASRQDVVLPFGATVEMLCASDALGTTRRIPLKMQEPRCYSGTTHSRRYFNL